MSPPRRVLRFALGTSLVVAASGCDGGKKGGDVPTSNPGPEKPHVNEGPMPEPKPEPTPESTGGSDEPVEPIHVNEGPEPKPVEPELAPEPPKTNTGRVYPTPPPEPAPQPTANPGPAPR